MSQSSSNGGGGIGVFGLLGVSFVVLKLAHVIEWSWLWVTLPFWGGIMALLMFAGFCLAMAIWTGQVK